VREVEAVCGCFWGGRCGAEGERERARGLVWALDRALGLGGGCTRRDVAKRVLGGACRTAVVAAVYCAVGRTEGRSRERRWRSRPAELAEPAGTRSGGADWRGGRAAGGEGWRQKSRPAQSRQAQARPLPPCPMRPPSHTGLSSLCSTRRLVDRSTRHPPAPQSTPTSPSNPTRPPSIECLRVWHAVAPCYRSQFSALVAFVK
jgi:hypothetical protein